MNSLEMMLVGREIGNTIPISEIRVMSLNFYCKEHQEVYSANDFLIQEMDEEIWADSLTLFLLQFYKFAVL